MRFFKKTGILVSLLLIALLSSCEDGSGDDAPNFNLGGRGTGGSLASFMITGDYLYVLSGNDLKTFDLVSGDGLEQTGSLGFPTLLETIFLYESRLIVGSTSAVYFVDLNGGAEPSFISSYEHITACDPVVARNSLAYSTIRSTSCRGRVNGEDLLDVIDFSDINNPQVVHSRGLSTPYGLAVVEDFLFVCERDGISIFDNTQPRRPQFLDNVQLGDGVAFDIIPTRDYLIVVTSEGIFNVAYNQSGELEILGQITN